MAKPIKNDLASITFKDQTAVVTGTTNGLGLAMSEELIRRGVGTLIMGVRNVRRAEEIKQELLAKPQLRAANPDVAIHVVQLQMDDYKSSLAFVDQVRKLTTTIDIVLLNAGLGGLDFELAKSGHEKMMQVNVYSNALLTLELLPLLEHTAKAKGKPSRLTWVGSFVQMDHSLTKNPVPKSGSVIGFFDDKTLFKGSARYSDSKLMSTMFVQQLAPHINKELVILNDVSPGQVLTNFGVSYPFYVRALISVASVFMSKTKSLTEGVNKYVHAIGVAGQESHGAYLSDSKVAE